MWIPKSLDSHSTIICHVARSAASLRRLLLLQCTHLWRFAHGMCISSVRVPRCAQPWQRHVFHSWKRWSSCAYHAREPQQSHWEREPRWVKFASMSISYLMSLRLAPLPFTKSFKSRIMRTWKAGKAMIEQTTWVRKRSGHLTSLFPISNCTGLRIFSKKPCARQDELGQTLEIAQAVSYFMCSGNTHFFLFCPRWSDDPTKFVRSICVFGLPRPRWAAFVFDCLRHLH